MSSDQSKYNGEERRTEVSDYEQLKFILIRLEEKVDTQVENTKDLIDAWNTAKGLSGFIKWLSSIVVAIIAVTGVMKGWFRP